MRQKSCVCMIVVALMSYGQTVDVSGMVRDSVTGEPLPLGFVYLGRRGWIAETDSSGRFSLYRNESTLRNDSRGEANGSMSKVLSDGNVAFRLRERGPVTITVHDPRGRAIHSQHGTYESGLTQVNVGRLAPGVYLYHIALPGRVHILKYRSLGSPRFSGRIGRKVLPHGVSSLHKKVDGDGVLDTLVAGYPGYNAKRITLYDLQNRGIEIMLSRLDVSPWKGLGPLEYRGKMVRIHAAGHCFQMGTDPATAWWARPEEMPHHRVSFSYDFWMDTAEVTRAEYSVMMKRFYNIEIVPWREPSSTFWTPSEEEPAHFLSWYDAVLYCNARTLADGRTDTVYRYDSIIGDPGDGCTLEGVTADLSRGGYRLPTEAEWEYACRAANPYENYWVSGPPVTFAGAMRELFENAWGRRSYYPRPMPVGTKKPNAYGLYDMIGNVFEWCNDWYGPYDTEDQTDPVGPAQGSLRVMRGGSCEVYYPDDPQNRATSATRWAKAPETVNRPIGIRVVLPVR